MSRITAEDKKLVARMKEIRDLIKEFKLTLIGYDPGISAYWDERPGLKGGPWSGPLRFEQHEWEWLEPLLKELREFRRLGVKRHDELASIPPEKRTAKQRKELIALGKLIVGWLPPPAGELKELMGKYGIK